MKHAWKKLKSPKQLEDAFAESAPKGKKKTVKDAVKVALADVIESQSSGKALVPDSDNRKPVERIAAPEDFEDVGPSESTGKTVADLF